MTFKIYLSDNKRRQVRLKVKQRQNILFNYYALQNNERIFNPPTSSAAIGA